MEVTRVSSSLLEAREAVLLFLCVKAPAGCVAFSTLVDRTRDREGAQGMLFGQSCTVKTKLTRGTACDARALMKMLPRSFPVFSVRPLETVAVVVVAVVVVVGDACVPCL